MDDHGPTIWDVLMVLGISVGGWSTVIWFVWRFTS